MNQTENLSKSEVFTDVPTNHWANAYIGRASQLGIVAGYGNGKFGPGDPVTYEQAITMIVRAIGESDKAISCGGYPDGFIKIAQEKNLLTGIQAEKGQGLTRGCVAILLYNYYINLDNPAAPEDGHIHNYVEKVVPGSGHYEQVQVGTQMIYDYVTGWKFGCNNKACNFITYDRDEMHDHEMKYGHSYWMQENAKIPNGYHLEPKYETQWVEDTIRICETCGQQEP